MSEKTSIKILGVEIFRCPQPVSGWRIVAAFDCEANGFELKGCSLLVGSDGMTVTAWPPKMEAPGTRLRKIKFLHPQLRNDVTAAALGAFNALGGTMPERIRP